MALATISWSTAVQTIFAATTTYLLGLAIYNRFFHPLRHFPGPFWASITPLWYWYSIRYSIGDNYQLAIHKRYGSMVRAAPDIILIADASAVETIYGPRNEQGFFKKSDFYKGFASQIGARCDSFCEQDPVKHAERRRIQAPLYTQGAISSYEPCVDRVVDLFVAQMDRYAKARDIFDISIWMHKYAFDAIGEIFYGKEGGFGMIRDNIDYNGWCKCLETMSDIGAAMTYMPAYLRPFWLLSEVLFGGADARAGLSNMEKVKKDAKEATTERIGERSAETDASTRPDMLNKLLDIVDSQGEKLNWTTLDVATELWAIIWAGSDTTAISLVSIMYNLHKNPEALNTLRKEMEVAIDAGALSMPIRYNDAVKLPYLNAVVQEAMRVCPSLGPGLPRIVPAAGARICGEYIAGGTTVIMDQLVVHMDKNIFGEDVEAFKPERWLADKQKAAKMARHDLSFGYGSRICIGKHITRIEMFKLVPTLLMLFDFEFDRPDRTWKVHPGWFQRQSDVFMRVRRRSAAV
ncbi:hypothetical protein AC579_6731 [Pseudocercospora musae]|uniref:Cytochrome P450 n=1 Tax=Pseudocercospora musae TaxID=113226 RepID=A0A139H919_9PEZI|nr:hypothetical protein AC579_6731 [Pseudocercospora musae]